MDSGCETVWYRLLQMRELQTFGKGYANNLLWKYLKTNEKHRDAD